MDVRRKVLSSHKSPDLNQLANDYFTIVSLSNNNTIEFYYGLDNGKLEYTIDGQVWNTLAAGGYVPPQEGSIITINSGDEVRFKYTGFLNNIKNGFGTHIGHFVVSKAYLVKGNVMSLVFGEDFRGRTTLQSNTGEYFDLENIFSELFIDERSLIDASDLILPATTLAVGCYTAMFVGCTSLTAAPELPAKDFSGIFENALYCYDAMFRECKSLTIAPELPATVLAGGCYRGMFWGCTNLVKAPELPATVLKNGCYEDMFRDCISLTNSPILSAATLSTYCYYNMFSGCTNLSKITMLATDISSSACLSGWVNNVAKTGTFVKNSEMTELPTDSINGIPTGWTVQNVMVTTTPIPSITTTSIPPVSDPYNGYEYVDLGLSSGTLWAKCNIGAEKESDYGLYFAWGETVGYSSDDVRNGKKPFDGTDYKWNEGEWQCDGSSMTKYNLNDSLTTLLPEDDAASVNMGGSWHMPSKEQIEELINSSYTTTTWTTVNGVNGRLITSKTNNNTLFLPASGYCGWGSVFGIGSNGCYWSSSLDENYSSCAWDLGFYSSHISYASGSRRFGGGTVRGVIGEKNEETTTTPKP